jgi:hypothetical protein
MAKSSPEKLAGALRANLRRRKQQAPPKSAELAPKPAVQPPKKPPKNSG